MRKLDDWVKAYMEYTEDTEPAKPFHLWTAYMVISAALMKKVSLTLGRLDIYPNMYCVFVADPGVARKTQAINMGVKLLNKIPNVTLSADSTTREALLCDIEDCAQSTFTNDGREVKHSSMTIISREFESFLGQKKENSKLLVMLTDLFDCQELPFRYRTKNSGSNSIPSVYLSMLAATTPDSLASSLPPTAIGGGLTSRIMFIWADKRYKKCPRPKETPAVIQLREDLVHDLHIISTMSGVYNFSPECGKLWDDWYYGYEELDPNRICNDPSFNSWYSRKPMYILKLATVIAASRSNRMILEWEHIQDSMGRILEVENKMGLVFRAIGKSAITGETDTVARLIAQYKHIKEKQLMSIVWRDMDALKFENVINTVLKTGQAVRRYMGPDGSTGEIWYYEINTWYEVEARLKNKRMEEVNESSAN